jgi:hypothetical protein
MQNQYGAVGCGKWRMGNETNSISYHFFTFAVLIVYGFLKLIIYQDDDKGIN